MKAAPMARTARRSNSKAVIAVFSFPVIANRGAMGDRGSESKTAAAVYEGQAHQPSKAGRVKVRDRSLTVQHAVPAIHGMPEFAAAGGLISYGVYLSTEYRQAGISVGRILKGENPANLPVTQARKVELIINMKTAKALDLTIPLTLLARR
jgi:hypothetical protein